MFIFMILKNGIKYKIKWKMVVMENCILVIIVY